MTATLTEPLPPASSDVVESGSPTTTRPQIRAAEFFAGIGLVRCGLEREGVTVVWANDIAPTKHAVYAANFGTSHYVLGDIRSVSGRSVPAVDMATASFPCVDLSLAGHRRGLAGEHSGLFFEFTRVLREMGQQAPHVLMVENVASFVSSRGGRDLTAAVRDLNRVGYVCDLILVDARMFTPQSRPRLFIVGTRQRLAPAANGGADRFRPAKLASFVRSHPELRFQRMPLPDPLYADRRCRLSDVVERLDAKSRLWWDATRQDNFVGSLSARHGQRLDTLVEGRCLRWRTAYRHTRAGVAVWEIRNDDIAGCLRTARGGSSRQALVEAGRGEVRVRWMTPLEYARLQGAPPGFDFSCVTESQALHGFGDAVCVPVISWLTRNVLVPAVDSLRDAFPGTLRRSNGRPPPDRVERNSPMTLLDVVQ